MIFEPIGDKNVKNKQRINNCQQTCRPVSNILQDMKKHTVTHRNL
nr:MAG TPA: hypothetical protein [Caudoviricetes sp.]